MNHQYCQFLPYLALIIYQFFLDMFILGLGLLCLVDSAQLLAFYSGSEMQRKKLRGAVIAVVAVISIAIILSGLYYSFGNAGVSPQTIATYTATSAIRTMRPSPTASLTLLPSATLDAATNCTYTIFYWSYIAETLPYQIVIGREVFGQADIGLLMVKETEDLREEMLRQLMVTFLNYLAGADQTAIEAAISSSYKWLVTHPAGNELSENDQQEARELISVLRSYNTGVIGPGSCQDDLRKPPPTATSTPTLTSTITPTQPTPTASSTPSPTPTRTRGPYVPPTATKEPESNNPPPTQPPPPTTEPPPPTTTEPPPPPTTEPPPPTPTLTEVPASP